jgi:hypothetical protein
MAANEAAVATSLRAMDWKRGSWLTPFRYEAYCLSLIFAVEVRRGKDGTQRVLDDA